MFTLHILIALIVSTIATAIPTTTIAGGGFIDLFLAPAPDDYLSSGSDDDNFFFMSSSPPTPPQQQQLVHFAQSAASAAAVERSSSSSSSRKEEEDSQPGNHLSTADATIAELPELPEEEVSPHNTLPKFVIAGGAAGQVEDQQQQEEMRRMMTIMERFQKFECGNSNGVCCMGNPLVTNRAPQRCDQSKKKKISSSFLSFKASFVVVSPHS